jgi:hypothetical protein
MTVQKGSNSSSKFSLDINKNVSDWHLGCAEHVTDRLLYLSDGASQMATDHARSSREIRARGHL